MAFALPYHTPYWGFLCFVDEKNMLLIKECKSMVSFFPNHFALSIANGLSLFDYIYYNISKGKTNSYDGFFFLQMSVHGFL